MNRDTDDTAVLQGLSWGMVPYPEYPTEVYRHHSQPCESKCWWYTGRQGLTGEAQEATQKVAYAAAQDA